MKIAKMIVRALGSIKGWVLAAGAVALAVVPGRPGRPGRGLFVSRDFHGRRSELGGGVGESSRHTPSL